MTGIAGTPAQMMNGGEPRYIAGRASSPVKSVTIRAPAKINLALHVVGRPADGYHHIETLVVFTELADMITASPAHRDRFSITGPYASSLTGKREGGDNLVIRARDHVDAALPLAGPRPAVALTLTKNLPVASGIGGGSSDAAATLRALEAFYGLSLSAAVKQEIALALGADVAMCLSNRPLIARGIGDQITAVTAMPALDLVLVNPGIAVPTPDIFKALSKRKNPPLPPLDGDDCARAERLVDWLATTRNDLQETAGRLYPPVCETLADLQATNPLMARMSGSGATCFAIYPGPRQAATAARRIAADHPDWFVRATRSKAATAQAQRERTQP